MLLVLPALVALVPALAFAPTFGVALGGVLVWGAATGIQDSTVKALVADSTGNPTWRRVLPPMMELPIIEESRMIADFRAWEATLPISSRSLYRDESETDAKIVALRRG